MKVASFYDDEDNEHAVRITDGECEVPDEVTDGKYFKIKLFGKKDNMRISTNSIIVRQVM